MRNCDSYPILAATVLALIVALPATTHAIDDGVRCQADKLKSAGKYESCRLKAESKAVKKSLPAAVVSRCNSKLQGDWAKIESRGGVACPSLGDGASIQVEMTSQTDYIAWLLAGNVLTSTTTTTTSTTTSTTVPVCGDGAVVTPEECDFLTLDGNDCTSVPGGFVGGDLACSGSCTFDTSDCYTTRFDDSGDTVIDNVTGLEWEKKNDDGGLRDVDNKYCWDAAACPGSAPTTGNIYDWVAALNTAAYSGSSDWGIPNADELQSIIDYGAYDPAVGSAFDNVDCVGGCSSCSCIASNQYWTDDTYVNSPATAWYVYFVNGNVGQTLKTSGQYVRAVRDLP